MTRAFAAQFAAEVERLMKAEHQDDGGHKAQLEARITTRDLLEVEQRLHRAAMTMTSATAIQPLPAPRRRI